MTAFVVGDRVYVPCMLVPELKGQDTALYKTKVSSIVGNSSWPRRQDRTWLWSKRQCRSACSR